MLFQFPPWFRAGHAEPRAHPPDRAPSSTPTPWPSSFAAAAGSRDEPATARTLSFLESEGASYVSVDEPQGFANSTPPLAVATTDLAVVRFHGRNRDTWQIRGRSASDRFNYLYDEAELGEWVPQIRALAARAATVHVLFNNNYRDYGVRNARQMTALLGLESVAPAGADQRGAPAEPGREPPPARRRSCRRAGSLGRAKPISSPVA